MIVVFAQVGPGVGAGGSSKDRGTGHPEGCLRQGNIRDNISLDIHDFALLPLIFSFLLPFHSFPNFFGGY